MIRRILCTLLLCGIAMCAESAESGISGETPLQIWLRDIAQRFAQCVGQFGVSDDFPVAQQLPPASEMLGTIVLAKPVMVSDGYHQSLMVHGPSNSAFIVQSGGFAGYQTIYGPISLGFQCQQNTGEEHLGRGGQR
jgi:hypothetical protein